MTQTVFITQYALTNGILEREVVHDHGDGYVTTKWLGGINGKAVFGLTRYSKTADEALAQAEVLRTRKIESLEKQITKLRKMQFDVSVKAGRD